jgi:hypothetical protein
LNCRLCRASSSLLSSLLLLSHSIQRHVCAAAEPLPPQTPSPSLAVKRSMAHAA